jgi:2-oxo-4-hydroxy-4-carboxy-5-ureidoimidazoline decarboxylase
MQDNRIDFIDTYGGIYEHSPWVAETVFDQGHGKATPMELIGPMRAVVESASPDMQMVLLRAHPDLAGKLAKTGELTAESTSEQASAGLDQCSDAEFEEFTALNNRYKERFGFPYILAVRGRNRHEILDNFRSRVDNDMATEFREALNQVHQIARLRLESLNGQA